MLLEGHPLTWWPMKAAQETALIDRIYVSTDDPDIVRIAREFDARVIERPTYLASKEALGEEAYVHAHQHIVAEGGPAPELYVLLMANAVTISPEQLTEGITELREKPRFDSAVTVSRYNMWSPLRARREMPDGSLQPFVPFETFGDPATLDCDRDSQGDVWFADMGVSIVRPRNLDFMHTGLLPQKWMGQRIHPIRNEGGLDVDYAYQIPQAAWWLRENRPQHCR
jgi:hypothetical protein